MLPQQFFLTRKYQRVAEKTSAAGCDRRLLDEIGIAEAVVL